MLHDMTYICCTCASKKIKLYLLYIKPLLVFSFVRSIKLHVNDYNDDDDDDAEIMLSCTIIYYISIRVWIVKSAQLYNTHT